MSKNCANCIYLRGCMWNSEYSLSPCEVFEDKSNYRPVCEVQAETFSKVQAKLTQHFGTYTGKDTISVYDVFKALDKIKEEILDDAK